jgi:hypothetical protein
MNELREGEPMVNVDGEDLEFREGCHASADSQQREISEYSDKRRDLIH